MTAFDKINEKFPIRRRKEEKENFRSHLINELSKKRITAREEKAEKGNSTNLIIGSPETAKLVFTAHYDTPARSVVSNLMMPRNPILLYLFHFLPIIFILALSLVPALLISEITGIAELYAGVFLVIYFGLFYLLYFAITNKNNFNDNTSGVATVLQLIEKLPEEKLEDFAFILFDNEEKGKLGSKAYFKMHKDFMREKTVINFDCVGNGNNILFIAMKEAENSKEYTFLKESVKTTDAYTVAYYPARTSQGNSDHKSFPRGICCMACSKSKRGGILYTARIHTNKDTKVNTKNIDFITENILKLTEKL